jgi:hypothetical protein
MMMVDEGREDDPQQRSVNEAGTNSTPSQIPAWRLKAEGLRRVAAGMKSKYARQLMLNAAANYDRWADEAERSEASQSRLEAC